MRSTLNIPGIYQILNNITKKSYVGYAVNLRKRLTIHKFYLRHNREGNKGLQKDWNIYGESNFSFLILQECSIENLCVYEHCWMNKLNTLDSNFGYNIKVTNPNDLPIQLKKRKRVHPLKGIRPSELCMQRGKEYWSKNPMTEEHKNACREGLKKVDWIELRRSKRKKVINTITGQIYDSLSIASETLGMTKHKLSKYLLGTRTNKTTYKYL